MNPAGNSSPIEEKLDGLNIVTEILRDLLDSDKSTTSSSSSRSETDEGDNIPLGSIVNIVYTELSTDIVRAASIPILHHNYSYSSPRCSTPKIQLGSEILPVLTSYESEEEGFSTSLNDSATDSKTHKEEEDNSPRCPGQNEHQHQVKYQYNSINWLEDINLTRNGLCDEDSGLYSAEIESNGTGKTLSISEAFQDTQHDVAEEYSDCILAADKFNTSVKMEQNMESFEDLLEESRHSPQLSSTSTLSQMIETATNAIIDESISQVMVLNMTTPDVSFTSEGSEDFTQAHDKDTGFENLNIGHPEDHPDAKIPSKLCTQQEYIDKDETQLERIEIEKRLFHLSQFLAKSVIDETIEEIGRDTDIDSAESSDSEEEEKEQITARRTSINDSTNPAEKNFADERKEEEEEEECKTGSAIFGSMDSPQTLSDSDDEMEAKSASSGSDLSAELHQENKDIEEHPSSYEGDISSQSQEDQVETSNYDDDIPQDVADLSPGDHKASPEVPLNKGILDRNLSSSTTGDDEVRARKGFDSSSKVPLCSQVMSSEISHNRSDGEINICEEDTDSTNNADTLSTLSSVNNENVDGDISEINREYEVKTINEDEAYSLTGLSVNQSSTNQQAIQSDDGVEASEPKALILIDDEVAFSVPYTTPDEDSETEYGTIHSGAEFVSRYILAIEENIEQPLTKPGETTVKGSNTTQDEVDIPSSTEYDCEYERLLTKEPILIKDSFDYKQRESALHSYLVSKVIYQEEEDSKESMIQADSKDWEDVTVSIQPKESDNLITGGLEDVLDEEKQKVHGVPENVSHTDLAFNRKCEYMVDLKSPIGLDESKNLLTIGQEDRTQKLSGTDQIPTVADEKEECPGDTSHYTAAVQRDSYIQDTPVSEKSSISDDWISTKSENTFIKTSIPEKGDRWYLPEFATSSSYKTSNFISQPFTTRHYETATKSAVPLMEMTKLIQGVKVSRDIDEDSLHTHSVNESSDQSNNKGSLNSGEVEQITTLASIPSIKITEPIYSDDIDPRDIGDFYGEIPNENMTESFHYSPLLSSPRKISTSERQIHTKLPKQLVQDPIIPSRTNSLHGGSKMSRDSFYEAILNESIEDGFDYYFPKRSSTPQKKSTQFSYSDQNGGTQIKKGSSLVRPRFDLDSSRESSLRDVDNSIAKCSSITSSYQRPQFSHMKQRTVSLCKMTQGMAETLAAVRDNLRLSQKDIKNIGEDFTRTESRVKRLFEEHPSTQRKYQGSGIAASHWFSTETGYKPKERECRTREELRQQIHELELLNHSSSSDLALTESNLDSLRQENRELRASFENEVIDLKLENTKMKDKVGRINEISAENLLLASDSADLQGELAELRTEARSLRNRCHEFTEDNRQLKMEVRDLRRYIDAMAKNKRTDASQDLLDKIDYYQGEHDRLLEEVRGLKQRLGSITPRSPRSRSPERSRSPRQQSPSKSLQSSKEVRFRNGSLEKPTARDAIAASTATSHGADRVIKDRGMSPSVALNLRDLTMDRYQKHLDGGHDSPRSVGSDSTEMLLNQQPTMVNSKRTTCGGRASYPSDDDEEFNEMTKSGLTNGKLSGLDFDKSGASDCSKRGRMTPTKLQSTASPLGAAGYRSISPRNTSSTHSTKSCTERYPPQITQSLPRRAFAPRNPSDLRLGYAIKFTRPGGKVSRGTVKFMGHLSGRSEVFVGVESDNHDGKHSGTFQGKKYFSCPSNKGIFTPFSKIILAWE